jgi:hypothetical protein
VDYSAFFALTTPDEVAKFTTVGKERMLGASPSGVTNVVALAVVGVFALFFGGSTFIALFGALATPDGLNPVAIGMMLVILLAVAGIVWGVVVVARANGRSKWERWMRLTRFADANGLVFSPRDENPNYPGAIFADGHTRTVLEHLRSDEGRFLDIGSYEYVTGSGKNRAVHRWGFMAFNLDRSLPHMVLDARANNGLFGSTNLPASFNKNQVLSLEGDFDTHFTLYCPREYERDALYVFTPDLMALLIDEAAPFDVEIIDNWMFVYSRLPFKLADPHVLQRLFRILDTVGQKTITQTDFYADERIGDRTIDMVAPQGQRLKRGFSAAFVITVVIVVVMVVWNIFGNVIAR